MHRLMLTRTTAVLAAALLLASPLSATAATLTSAADETTAPDDADGAALLLLLDASRSMEDPDARGEPKIDAARAAMHDVIDGLDPAQSVGLRVFGGSVTLDRPMEEKCSDSELVVPVDTDNADALSAAVDDYAPLGETPIAHALQQAAEDLGDEGQRTVVLVSDGIATCDPDPCEVAEQLTADGLDLVVHTVGLGADEETRSQLRCVADAGGGTYSDATDTESLTSVLATVSTRAFRPFTISGTPVVGTFSAAEAPALTAGQYTDTLAADQENAKLYRVVRQTPGSTLHVGVSMRPERGGASSYNLQFETLSGERCGFATGTPFSMGVGHSFGTASMSSGRDRTDGPCVEDDELVLRLHPGPGSDSIAGAPLEIVVVEEPPVANLDDLPSDDAPRAEWSGTEPGDPADEVVPGSSLNDALPIEPGRTYSSELTRGEIVFFRVPVEHGQRLEAIAEFPRPTGALAETTGPVSDIADIQIVGPTRGQAHDVLADLGDLGGRAIIAPDRAVRAAASTYEVRWANRAGANSAGASMAGDYYVAVSITSSEDLLLPMPFTLTTQLVGDVSGVPEYVSGDAAGTDDAQAATEAIVDATPAPAQESAEPQAAADRVGEARSEGNPGWLLWTLGAGGVLVAGAGAVLLGRRRA